MKYLSVCAGIEAATVAWHHMGWEPVAFSEIEKFPSAVLAHHYPSVPNWGDMTKFKDWPDANIDVLVGGTPCQSFSVAGLRKGLDDPRGNLMLTFGAIAKRYRPEWLVWENVPGVLSSNGGRDFGAFLGMLAELGYGFAYRVLDAQYFGVPQRRRRVFVCAVRGTGNWQRAAAVLFERHSLSGHPAPSRQARKGTAGGVASGATASGWPADVSPTLTADFASKQGQENQHINGGAGLFVPVAFDAFNQADTGDLSKTVAARNDQDTASLVSGCWWDGGDVAATITTKSDDQRMPDKANAQLVMQPLTFKVRGGCEGGGKGYLGSDDAAFTVATTQDQWLAQPISFGAQMSVPQTDVDMVQTLQAKNPMAVAQPIPYDLYQITAPVNRQNRKPGDPCHTLARDNAAHAAVAIQGTLIGRGENAGPQGSGADVSGAMFTLTKTDVHAVAQYIGGVDYENNAHGMDEATGPLLKGSPTGGGRPLPAIATAMQVRRLLPEECEKLQGFLPGYTNIPWRGKPESPDGPRYKALGNSMAVPVMSWIGERINEVGKL